MSGVTERIKHELRELLPPTIFFLIAFHVITVSRALMLRQYGVPVSALAGATIGALLWARPLAQRWLDQPSLEPRHRVQEHASGRVLPDWARIEGTVLAPDLAEPLNMSGRRGYLLKSVAKGSPGEALGLRGGTTVATIDGQEHVLGGDLILDIDGIPMDSTENIVRTRRHPADLGTGVQYVVRVLCGGREVELTGRMP